MKRISRLFIFSIFALFLTSYWNKGFIFPQNVNLFLGGALLITFFFFLIQPIAKIVFLPLNLITFGLFSFIFYIFILHIGSSIYHLYKITSWTFPGLHFFVADIPRVRVEYLTNLVLCSLSISSIINLLDQLT